MNTSLFFECQYCKKMVEQKNPGAIWLDNGATLFCPECGNGTKVHLETGFSLKMIDEWNAQKTEG